MNILGDFSTIIPDILDREVRERLRDFFVQDLPRIAHDEEVKLDAELATIAVGSDFHGLLVVEATLHTITVFKKFDRTAVPFIPGLTLDILDAAIEIERHVNLTNSQKPIVDIVKIAEFTIEIDLKYDPYTFRIGGGADARGEQYLVGVDLKSPPLRFRGLLAKGKDGGFVIWVHSGLPVPIPLASTGLGLTGIGLLYGERFAPWLGGGAVAPSDPIAAMRDASAQSYVEWAQQPDLKKWLPVDQDLRIYGLSADIGDISSKGEVLEAHEAGITYFSYGPTLVLGGYLKVLSTDIATILGAIDLRSKSTYVAGASTIELMPGILVFAGSVAMSASLSDQTKTWMALGGYDMKGCSVNLLGVLQLSGGFRLVPLQGAAARAAARVEAKVEVCGVGGGYSFSIDMSGYVGWNPVELGGQLDVGGAAWIDIFGTRLGLGIAAHLALQIARPKKLTLAVEYSLDLPWPLSPIRIPQTIFDYDDSGVNPPAAGMTLATGAPLGYIHACSGTIGQLEGPNTEVWPDVSFDIPFLRVASGPTIIVNRAQSDGQFNEGGVAVSHRISLLEIAKIDETTGVEQVVPDVNAAWLGMNVAKRLGRTSRLAIPCNDPLAWLQSFEYDQPGSAAPVERSWFQTFGTGPDEDYAPTPPSTPATFDLDDLRISNLGGFRLSNLLWTAPYARAISTRDMTLEVAQMESGARVPLPVKRYDIRCVSQIRPDMRTDNGTSVTTKVRDLGGGFSEWSVTVTRAAADARRPLRVDEKEAPFTVVAVGYTLDMMTEIGPGSQIVFKPGLYKLYIDGTSQASYGGAPAVTPWSQVRRFRVIAPPQLRPYLRYASFGDERGFGIAHPGWNPNPAGMGFGHYRGHKGVIRAKVSYLSKIYSRLWIANDRGGAAVPVRVSPCTDGSTAGGGLGAAWPVASGGVRPTEEELVFDLPNQAGEYLLQVQRSLLDTGTDLFKIDEWRYRVSQFDDPREHLKPPANRLSDAYGPFGVLPVTATTAPDLPSTLDFDALPAAKFIPNWSLAPWIGAEPGFSNPDLGLSFLRLFEWVAFFEAAFQGPQARITSRPPQSSLNLLMDATSRPTGLFLRTPEPVDWRRVTIKLAHGNSASFERLFTTRVFPSPDGCSAVILPMVDGVPVRVPRGQFGLQVRFALRQDDLPSLVATATPTDVASIFAFSFEQPQGRAWDV